MTFGFFFGRGRVSIKRARCPVRPAHASKENGCISLSVAFWPLLLITPVLKDLYGCICAVMNPTRPVRAHCVKKNKTLQISRDTKQLAHRPQIILIKTNIWPFHALLPGIWCCALSHIPCSPSPSSRYTPFDLSGRKVLRGGGGEKAQITEEILLSF